MRFRLPFSREKLRNQIKELQITAGILRNENRRLEKYNIKLRDDIKVLTDKIMVMKDTISKPNKTRWWRSIWGEQTDE